MKVRFNEAAVVNVTGVPNLVQPGQVLDLDSRVAQTLIRVGYATAVIETTDAAGERSHACTPFQQSGAAKQHRQRPSQ